MENSMKKKWMCLFLVVMFMFQVTGCQIEFIIKHETEEQRENEKSQQLQIFDKESNKDAVAETKPEKETKNNKNAQEVEFILSQIDVSNYPTVRMYFHLEDLYGNYIENAKFENEQVNVLEGNGTWKTINIIPKTQIKHKNISFVIDVSGSMEEDNKYDYAKDAINTILDSMERDGSYAASLLAFNDTQNLLEDFNKSYTNLRAELNDVQLSGGTAFWDSLELALLKANAQQGQKCIIAASDGLDNSSITTRENIVELSKQLQIPIYIIAFDEITADEMEIVAENTGGECFTIDNVSSLQDIYQKIFTRQEHIYFFMGGLV